jgi:AAA family ATP:ADP antiporter
MHRTRKSRAGVAPTARWRCPEAGREDRRWRPVAVRAGEGPALFWSFGYFFFLLAGYYLLRPLRDVLGIAAGVRNLSWLFTATFVVLVLVQPLYGAALGRLSRRRFIPLVYRFFAAQIVLFWLLLGLQIGTVYVARAFFVWMGVFSLFVVSVFWSFMADLYSSEQSKRLFGFIGAGGTAGSLIGPSLAMGLSALLGPFNLLVIAALLLELAVFCARRLEKSAARMAGEASPRSPGTQAPPAYATRIAGGAAGGLRRLVRSPYLLGIACWVSLLSLCATVLYLEQASIVAAATHSRAVQTRIFASIDLLVAILTLAIQVFATGPFIVRFGVGAAAASLPAVFALGFAALGALPGLAAVVVFQTVQRAVHFSLAGPARQALFTVAAREDKYKVKNVIDLVVYRGSDAVWSWLFLGLRRLRLSLAAIALLSLLAALAWCVIAVALGRTLERRAAAPDGPPPSEA